jgi:hypothetical protein
MAWYYRQNAGFRSNSWQRANWDTSGSNGSHGLTYPMTATTEATGSAVAIPTTPRSPERARAPTPYLNIV